MIVEEAQSIRRIGNFKEFSYRADQENLGALFHILRNQLYSDKITAVIREYSTNAADIHQETDQTRPFEVRLPSQIEPTLRIRDFGTGLSLKELAEDFVSMGKSSKKESNLLNGCLGIGCKSGFAYSDTFDIISRHENEYIEATAYVDESRVGKLTITTQRNLKPNEEHGLEIRIPFREEDFQEVKSRAIAVLSVFVFPPKLFEKGEEIKIKSKITGSPIQFNYVRKYNNNSRDHIIYCGNVAYPFDPEKVDIYVPENTEVKLEMPLGSFNFSASRESIEYDKKTRDAISDHFKVKIEEYREKVKVLDRCASQWRAALVAQRLARREEYAKAKLQALIHYAKPGKEKEKLNALKKRAEPIFSYLFATNSLTWRGLIIRKPYKLYALKTLICNLEATPANRWIGSKKLPRSKTLVVLPCGTDTIPVSALRKKIDEKTSPWSAPAYKKAREEGYKNIIFVLHSKDWKYASITDYESSFKPTAKEDTLIINLPRVKVKEEKEEEEKTPEVKAIKYSLAQELDTGIKFKQEPKANRKLAKLKNVPKNKAKKLKITLKEWEKIQIDGQEKPLFLNINRTKAGYWITKVYETDPDQIKKFFGPNVFLLKKDGNYGITEKEMEELDKIDNLSTVNAHIDATKPKTAIISCEPLKKLLSKLTHEEKAKIKEIVNLYSINFSGIGEYKVSVPSEWISEETKKKEEKIWEKLLKRFPLLPFLDVSEIPKEELVKYLRIIKKTKAPKDKIQTIAIVS